MPSTGATYPTVAESVSPSGEWLFLSNVFSDNNQYASTNAHIQNSLSAYLRGKTFNFVIPAGSVIKGIQVEFGAYYNAPGGGSPVVRIESVVVVKNGVQVATINPLTALTLSEANYSYGGIADLWSQTWTPGDINDADFGFDVQFRETAAVAAQVGVDYLRMTIEYEFQTGKVSLPLLGVGW